jgi:hypothetical protein
VVPFLGEMSLETAITLVSKPFPSYVPGATRNAEGIVGRPKETLYDKKGSRVIIKLKTEDFIESHKNPACSVFTARPASTSLSV